MTAGPEDDPRWLDWAKRIQALAQSGLHFSPDRFDRERYERLRRLAAEMMAAGSGAPVERIEALFARQEGYATPKIDVRGAVFREGRVLLVREVHDGRWTLPGGWADVWDSPAEAAEREVEEEAGLRTRAVKLLAVWDRRRHDHTPASPFGIYKLVFRCEAPRDSEPRGDGRETDAAGFFAEDALPELSQGRVTRAQLARLFRHQHDPELPTEFD